MSDIVPFGKYKGRPVEDMLADAEYMTWLEAQPWFRERFKHLTARRDADAMSRTPVHNRLQAMFLDATYSLAFVRVAHAKALADKMAEFELERHRGPGELRARAADLEDHARKSEADLAKNPNHSWLKDSVDQDRKRAQALLAKAEELTADHPTMTLVRVSFETEGADVLIRTAVSGLAVERSFGGYNTPGHVTGVARSEIAFDCAVEIKPSVADEYPAVLRQMKRNKSQFLFVDRYEGEGATEAQFVLMFGASGKKVVFKRDVDAMAAKMREVP